MNINEKKKKVKDRRCDRGGKERERVRKKEN